MLKVSCAGGEYYVIATINIFQTLECSKSMSIEAKDTTKPALSHIILLTKGPFVTPRTVIKNMTTKPRPSAQEILQEMKKLEEEGLGTVMSITKTQVVYYKPVPKDENKEDVQLQIGKEQWDAYIAQVKEQDTTYMTASQYNCFLLESDDHNTLDSFGFTTREVS